MEKKLSKKGEKVLKLFLYFSKFHYEIRVEMNSLYFISLYQCILSSFKFSPTEQKHRLRLKQGESSFFTVNRVSIKCVFSRISCLKSWFKFV